MPSTQISLLAAELKTLDLDSRLDGHQVIAKPKSVEDVVLCVRAARATGCSVSVVGGNHSGYGKSGDLVLEMCHFTSLQLVQKTADKKDDSRPHRLCVGAGMTLKDLCVQAQAYGLAIPLGTAPTVGLGLVLQGGVGHLSRQQGLAVDAIRSVELVTAAGQVLEVSRQEDCANGDCQIPKEETESLADLLWALRGCAPNFGVVTSVTLEAVPFQHCNSVRKVFQVDTGAECLRDYLLWSSKLPIECSADCCVQLECNVNNERTANS